MRTGGLWRSLFTLGVAAIVMISGLGCQPRSDDASHRSDVAMPNTMPTVDHHPPARTPEN